MSGPDTYFYFLSSDRSIYLTQQTYLPSSGSGPLRSQVFLWSPYKLATRINNGFRDLFLPPLPTPSAPRIPSPPSFAPLLLQTVSVDSSEFQNPTRIKDSTYLLLSSAFNRVLKITKYTIKNIIYKRIKQELFQ